MYLETQLKKDIELLLYEARPKLIAADNGGGSSLFNEVSEEFGPIAHRVYLALDKPQRSCERYHDKKTRRVMLDPITTLNRVRCLALEGKEADPDNLEFWCHGDTIKSLYDYLDLCNSEESDACT